MKKTERILDYNTDISNRNLNNLSYFHELIHLYYDILKNSKHIKLMTWDKERLINKHYDIVKLMSRKGHKHIKKTELDEQKHITLKKITPYEAKFDNLSDFLNKTDFDFIKKFNLYKYNANKIVDYDLKTLKKSLAIELLYEDINLDELIKFVERFPNTFLITNYEDKKQKIILNLKSNIKPLICVKKNNKIFDKTKADNDLICIIHRLNTIRKIKIKIEGKIPEMNRKALNRIKNNIKKISENNFIAVGKFKKVGKKHMIEVYDLLYYDKRDLSKEPIKKRKDILNSLFESNELTHICRK